MDDLLSEFLAETSESLEFLDSEIVKLERNPTDRALLGNIFRILHSIKGTCGFIGLDRLEALAHAGENVLGRFREGAHAVTPGAIDLILAVLDRIREIVSALEATGAEPDGDDTRLIARLEVVLPEPGDATAPASATLTLSPASVPAEVSSPAAGSDETPGGGRTIRVDVALLDTFMTMVGELVQTRNQLLQVSRGTHGAALEASLRRLNRVTKGLQDCVTKTRLQPVAIAWSTLPRVARDLAGDLGKKVDLRVFGAETQLDRQLIETIRDPLLHMVRNAVDHGIETPAERMAAGKPEIGTITLNAYHDGSTVVVEIGDDGRGIDVARVREKAISEGLASAAEAAAMSDREICQFVFRAGLTTAEEVTNVSGRGVGLDVVRTNVDRIGGEIELRSDPGEGSTFVLTIPGSLTIVSALIVRAGVQRFAVPQQGVTELVQISGAEDPRLGTLRGQPVLVLGDRKVPLFSLGDVLKRRHPALPEGTRPDAARPMHDTDPGRLDESVVIVLEAGGRTVGIVAEAGYHIEEIVLRLTASDLASDDFLSGTAVLGDGGAVKILDAGAIVGATVGLDDADAAPTETGEGRRQLLVFRPAGDDLKAVALDDVACLDEIDAAAIDYSGGAPVVRYHGRPMPLVALSKNFSRRSGNRQPVIVYSDGERCVGLIADEILDIVDSPTTEPVSGGREGTIGSAVVAGTSVDIIDASHYLGAVSGRRAGYGSSVAGAGRRILLVDDSPYFRNQLAPLLIAAGYEVTTADGPDAVFALREAGESFDVILSDVSVAGQGGQPLAREIRSCGAWRNTPIVALSDRTTAHGAAAEFSGQVSKRDRDALLDCLSNMMGGLMGAA